MLVRPGNPDFLDLPWRDPLDQWESDRLVEVTRGIHRHVVRFVSYGERLYALENALSAVTVDPSRPILVGGVDTFLDLQLLATLVSEGRVYGRRVMGTALCLRQHDFPRGIPEVAT